MKSFSIGISITCTARIRRTSKSTSGLLGSKYQSITDDQNVLDSTSDRDSDPHACDKLNSVTYYEYSTNNGADFIPRVFRFQLGLECCECCEITEEESY